MMDSLSKMMKFALQMMDFVLKMTKFGSTLGGRHVAGGGNRGGPDAGTGTEYGEFSSR